MTDKIPDNNDDGRSIFGYTGINKNYSDVKKRSLDNEIPRKTKFLRMDMNKNLSDHQKGACVNEIPDIMQEKQVKTCVDDAVTHDAPMM
jgi:hypothetical protein